MKHWQNPANSLSPAELVADVIYTAVTDESDQLRYRAGADAHFLLDKRKEISDKEFFSMMRDQMGL